MAARIFVSGYGIVSSLGMNVSENLNALKNEKPRITNPAFLPTNHREMMVGEVKESNESLSKIAGVKFHPTFSRTILLGIIAAREALEMAGIGKAECHNTGLVSGTSVGGMDISERLYKDLLEGKPVSYQESFSGHDCGHSTQLISQHLRLKGYSSTISTACSSAANAIMHAGMLIRSGQMDCMVAGGCDALSLYTLNGFNALKILDTEWCKPFDAARHGLNLGEGAAYLVLESEAYLKKRGGKAFAELTGFGNCNDAFHQTASSPEGHGAFQAMQKALQVAGNPKIDYVNAHGTGTENNDQSESLALKRIFDDKVPPYSSTKAYTGHTLAAAGGIEAVYSLLALREQVIFPNLNFSTSMGLISEPVRALTSARVKTVLSNSFGFGGNCTALTFSGI